MLGCSHLIFSIALSVSISPSMLMVMDTLLLCIASSCWRPPKKPLSANLVAEYGKAKGPHSFPVENRCYSSICSFVEAATAVRKRSHFNHLEGRKQQLSILYSFQESAKLSEPSVRNWENSPIGDKSSHIFQLVLPHGIKSNRYSSPMKTWCGIQSATVIFWM